MGKKDKGKRKAREKWRGEEKKERENARKIPLFCRTLDGGLLTTQRRGAQGAARDVEGGGAHRARRGRRAARGVTSDEAHQRRDEAHQRRHQAHQRREA
jgi:hypothetical protein